MGETLSIEDRGSVRVLTLSRPDKLNAFNVRFFDSVGEALRAAASERSVSCVVVTALGRAFSAGLDLMDDTPPQEGRGFPFFMEELVSFPKPLVAAVNGLAVGVGLTMLTHCDIVIASTQARFKAPFVEIGLTGEAASTVTLPATVGWQRANYLLLAAPWISAQEAVGMGLALRAVEPNDLVDDALEIAEQIAKMPLESLMETKRLLHAGRIDAIRAARHREDEAFGRLIASPGHQRALQAFRGARER